MSNKENDAEMKKESLAIEVLSFVRRKLSSELPAFLPAIYLLPEEAVEADIPLCTDGSKLYYNSRNVIKTYAEDKAALFKQFLHVLAHALLGHIAKRKGQNHQLFDAAADLKAEMFLEEAAYKFFKGSNIPSGTKELLSTLLDNSLESIYLLPASSSEAANLIKLSEPLEIDNHCEWDNPQNEQKSGGMDGAMQAMWQAAAQKVGKNLVNMGQGDAAGMISESYGLNEPSGISYSEFLKQFMEICEMQKIDPDSIDNIWYRTGFEMMGDVTFVEPNEITEDAPKIHLAVAIDTSGSCEGDVMNRFLSELQAVIRDCGSMKYIIDLIQCDAEINKVDVFSEEDAFEDLTNEGMIDLCGWGGTDFRPVFSYINEQNETGEVPPIKGLLYLSDGYGDFPDKDPGYPVWFLLPSEDFNGRPEIPSWVNAATIEDDYLKIRE